MTGPYIQVATFCDKALEEKDGTLSIIRVIDRVTISTNKSDAPAELPEGGQYRTTLAIALKSDDAKGRHPVTIRAHQPSGQTLPDRPIDVIFDGEERGVNIIAQIDVEVIEGLYWFDVLVNDTLLTRIPLRFSYQRMPGAGA